MLMHADRYGIVARDDGLVSRVRIVMRLAQLPCSSSPGAVRSLRSP
jgi:hypothetical protein